MKFAFREGDNSENYKYLYKLSSRFLKKQAKMVLIL